MCDVNFMLLLDMDGVLLLNERIHNKVTGKSIEFMRKKMPLYDSKPLNLHMSRYINKFAYKTFGHTALFFGNDPHNVLDYNDYVFDTDTMNFIVRNLDFMDQSYFTRVSQTIESAFIRDVGLFTNTPFHYCETIMESLRGCNPSFTDRLLSVAFTSDQGLLKPTVESYELVERELRQKFSEVHFLDDSEKNFTPIQHNDFWFKVLVKSEHSMMRYLGREIKYYKDKETFLNSVEFSDPIENESAQDPYLN
jgi:hypothetical protein